MNFDTPAFALFFLSVASLYYILQARGRYQQQNTLLLIASYIFYGTWDHRFLFLILLSTAIDYTCGLSIGGQTLSRRTLLQLTTALLAAAVLLCAPIEWWAASRSSILTFIERTVPRDFGSTEADYTPIMAAVASVVFISIALDLGRLFSSATRRQYYLGVSVVSNLSILGFFKYFDFFVSSAERFLQYIGIQPSFPLLGIVVPVGISFYTFQTLSYTIDIYRRELEPTHSLRDFALFVAFFPQLVAGPIERAAVLLPQLATPRCLNRRALQTGFFLIGWGLYKKIFVADNLARFVEPVYAQNVVDSGPEVLFATYAFAFQIYCDFSAYSDIARGISRCLGVELMVNFMVPYVARNPQDFWRRWHISLSTWLRDYLYFSLGGNRLSALFVYRNLMLTMVLGGLWHGARLNFLWWGIYQGAWLCVHRIVTTRFVPPSFEHVLIRRIWQTMCWFAAFHLICYGWLLFRSDSTDQIWKLTLSLLNGWDRATEHLGIVIRIAWYCSILWIVQCCQVGSGNLLAPLNWRLPVRLGFYLIIFYQTIIFGSFENIDFIYFQF